MKYVVFKVGNIYAPIVFPDHVAHSQMAIKALGVKPVSAGFCYPVFTPGNNIAVTVSPIGSESLGLEPHYLDATILTRMVNNFPMSLFLVDALDIEPETETPDYMELI